MAVDSSGLNFGDNSGIFANDGECDDPRFEGPGSAFSTSESSEMRDADDCRSLFESGQLTLVAGANSSPSTLNSATTTSIPSTPMAEPEPEPYTIGTPRGDIDGALQEDGSLFASGTVYGDEITGDNNRMQRAPSVTPAPSRSAPTGGVDFGDNSSIYANDGECDDPRFEGAGMAAVSFDDDIRRDANDCRAAFQAGTITLIGN